MPLSYRAAGSGLGPINISPSASGFGRLRPIATQVPPEDRCRPKESAATGCSRASKWIGISSLRFRRMAGPNGLRGYVLVIDMHTA